MISEDNLNQISDRLLNDESFCRLMRYGENPFSVDYPDITLQEGYKDKLINDTIRFVPSTDDFQNNEYPRLFVYKQYSKLSNGTSMVRNDAIQLDIFVPFRLVNLDKRIYKIESTIENLLDGMPIAIYRMDYVDGRFVVIPRVQGYAEYIMTFEMREGRSIGKY